MNFGKITIATKWSEVTLKQFGEIMRIYKDEENKNNILDIIAVMTGRDIKELRLMPTDFINTLIEKLAFMSEKLEAEPLDKLTINGDEYVINHTEKLKFGEFTDVETTLKADSYNYPALLAILCRKKGEVYDDDFIANELDNRIKMYEELPITEALHLINFFLVLEQRYIAYSLKSSAVQEAKAQVESLVQSTENLVKSGAGKRLNGIYARIKLRKLKKQLKNI